MRTHPVGEGSALPTKHKICHVGRAAKRYAKANAKFKMQNAKLNLVGRGLAPAVKRYAKANGEVILHFCHRQKFFLKVLKKV